MKLILGLISFTALLISPFVSAEIIVKANETVDGKSLGEYSNIWWQWAKSMPNNQSPLKDKTGAKCHVNQKGPVWFLAGGYGTSKISRKCTVPRGKYIFFPVINMVQYPRFGERVPTCAAVKAGSSVNNNHLRAFIVKIDEQTFVNPVFHRVSSPDCFNLLGRVPKSYKAPKLYPAATDGYWIMLKPLSVGTHSIKFRAEYAKPGYRYGMMVQDIEYTIEIVES